MKFVIILLGVVSTAGFAQEPPPAATGAANTVVAGQVVSATGNQPVVKALVMIEPTEVVSRARSRPPERRADNRFVITEADGRFTFLNVPPGKYRLTAARPNEQPQAYLADGPYSTAIVTGGIVDTSHLVFPYHLSGAITGTVVDDQGEGIKNADVHLFQRQIIGGIVRLALTRQDYTNAAGVFHTGHLPAGEYYVGVGGRPWYSEAMHNPQSSSTRGSPDFDVAYPFTYYPATTDFSGANPIQVSEGNTATIQMSLHAVPAIHSRVAGMPAGDEQAAHFRMVQANVIGPNGQPLMTGSSVAFLSNNELTGIAPGHYQISIPSPATGRIEQVTDVTGNGDIQISDAPKIAVSGSVSVDSAEKPTNRVTIVLNNTATGDGRSAQASDDGTFTFPGDGLTPGKYRIAFPNNPAFTVRSVSAKGAKYQGGELELSAGERVQLAVVLTRNPERTLQGTVVDGVTPVPGAIVLLLPVEKGHDSQIRRDQSDLDGSFTLQGIVDGDYRLIAIDNGRDLAFGDPVVIAPYLVGGTRLSISTDNLPAQKVSVQKRKL